MSKKSTKIKAGRKTSRSPFDEVVMASLWGEEYTDVQIARIIGSSHTTIRRWRMRGGIPHNYNGPIQLSEEEEIVRISLWGEGYTDTEMARRVGRTMPALFYWRTRMGLSPNYKYEKSPIPEEAEILRASLWGESLCDKEIAEKLGLSCDDVICKWRHSKGIPANPSPLRTRLKLKIEDEIVRASLWGEGYYDKEIAQSIGMTDSGIRYWRHIRGIPRVERRW